MTADKPRDNKKRTFHLYLFSACVGLAVAAVFAPSLWFSFLNFDDDGYVTENPYLRATSLYSILYWAFTTRYEGNWHPITWLSHALDIRLFGLDSRRHHGINLFLHAANAVLLFHLLYAWVSTRFLENRQDKKIQRTSSLAVACLLAALFWALHPLRAEVVVWVAQRKELLATFFALTAFISYHRYVTGARRYAWLMTILFYASALLCKPMPITVPVLLLLVDRYVYNRVSTWSALRLCVSEKIPLFLLVLPSAILTAWAQQTAMAPLEALPLRERLGNALCSCSIYLQQMLCPIHLAPFYPFDHSTITLARVTVHGFVVLLVITAAVHFRKQAPSLIFGCAWFFIALTPVLGIIQVGQQAHADRYTYFPMLGFTFTIAAALARLFYANAGRHPAKYTGNYTAKFLVFLHALGGRALDTQRVVNIFTAVGVIVLGLLSLITRHHAAHWRDSEHLWRAALEKAGTSPLVLVNFAEALIAQQKTEEAEQYLQQALRLNDHDPNALYNLAYLYLTTGRSASAVPLLRRLVQIQPHDASAYVNLGVALLNIHQNVEAFTVLSRAADLDPASINAWLNLGVAAMRLYKLPEAERALRRAQELAPDHPTVLENLRQLRLIRSKTGEDQSESPIVAPRNANAGP